MPGGRPTKYDPRYCDEIVEFMREGASAVEFAAYVGVSRDTVSQWRKDYPEFSVAFARAQIVCQAWWEHQGRIALKDKDFNQTLWSFNVSRRFKEDWTERKEFTGKDGSSLGVIIVPEKSDDAS